MSAFGADRIRNETLLLARLLIALLFLIFGWEKLTGFSETVQYMAHVGAPLPALSAAIAVAMELFVGIAIVLGVYTRPLALLLALYTLGTAVIGHHYWTMTGMAHLENEIQFYKNISIIGGLLALYATGAGRYSLDARLDATHPTR
jgi:putative oxidoreductase